MHEPASQPPRQALSLMTPSLSHVGNPTGCISADLSFILSYPTLLSLPQKSPMLTRKSTTPQRGRYCTSTVQSQQKPCIYRSKRQGQGPDECASSSMLEPFFPMASYPGREQQTSKAGLNPRGQRENKDEVKDEASAIPLLHGPKCHC